MEIAFSLGEISSGLPVPTGGGAGTLQNIIFGFIELVLAIGVLFALFHMILGGINMIQSTGKKEQLKSGRERFFFAILGLIFIFISFLFINIISNFLGVNLLKISY